MAGDANPFASPGVDAVAVPLGEGASEAERIRRDHIANEASIKGVGSLAIFGGAVSLIFGLYLISLWGQASTNGRLGFVTGLTLGLIACGILHLVGGIMLRRLRRIGRAMVTASLGLNLLVTLATAQGPEESGRAVGQMLVPVLIIASLWRAKANTVFSDHYRLEIIPLTPHVKYRTPRWVWWLLGLLVLMLVVMIVGAVVK